MKSAFPKGPVRDLVDQLDLKELVAYKADQPVPEMDEQLLRAVLMEFDLEVDDDGPGLSFTHEGIGIEIRLSRMPVINISTRWEPLISHENLHEYQLAAELAPYRFDMVKVVGDVITGGLVWIEINARHTDVLSFRNNLKYYLDQLVQARLFIEGRSIPRHY